MLEPFETQNFLLTEEGLKATSTKTETAPIPIFTWRAVETTIPFNFTLETQYLTKYKSKATKNTLGKTLLDDTMIKPNLRFEVEARSSDFIELTQKSQLETAFINVYIDKSSIVDSLLANDISQNAVLKAQLISEDRRSFKERKSYLLRDFDFDHAIQLRLFNERDVVQILFIDDETGSERFVSIKCAELPLSLANRVPWYV